MNEFRKLIDKIERISESSLSDLDSYIEQQAIKDLNTLQQPIRINGGSFIYSANTQKDPYKWIASDGGEIQLDNLAELSEYLEDLAGEDWKEFLRGFSDIQQLERLGVLVPASAQTSQYY